MRKRAFTLIELLVVIAIIALLVNMVSSALKAVKDRARSVVCGSNIARLAIRFTIYNNENETFPFGFEDFSVAPGDPPGGTAGNAKYDKMGWWWLHYIMEEDLSKDSAVWCPSRKINNPSSKTNILCGNYGVNRSVCKDAYDAAGVIDSEFVGRPLGISRIRNPSKTLIITDSGYSLVSWKAAANEVEPRFDNVYREKNFYIPGMSINKSRILNIDVTPLAIPGRHPKRTVNIAYSDGHMSNVPADTLTVKKTGSGFSNLDLLWRGQ